MIVPKIIRSGFLKHDKGSVVTISATTIPILLGIGVFAVDVGYVNQTKTELQNAIDLAALSALTQIKNKDPIEAHTLSPQNAKAKYQKVIVDAVNRNAPQTAQGMSVSAKDIEFGHWDFRKKEFDASAVNESVNAVKIKAIMSQERGNPVPTLLGSIYRDNIDMTVETHAVLPVPFSYHMLSNFDQLAFELAGGADADVSTLQVNSTSSRAVSIENSGGLGMGKLHVAGRTVGAKDDVIKENRYPIADFLGGMKMPSSNRSCKHRYYHTFGDHPILKPGVYCKGLIIANAKTVEFEPGLYILKDGPLTIAADMAGKDITGKNVTMFFDGKNSGIRAYGGSLTFSSAQSGEWAGVPFVSARGSRAPLKHILRNTRLYVDGVFYAPTTDIDVENGSINGTCNHVCMIAKTLRLNGTFINHSYYRANTELFGKRAGIPARPPALEQTFRPYIVERN